MTGDEWAYPLGSYLYKTDYTFKEIKDKTLAIISATGTVTKKPGDDAGYGLPPKDSPLGGWITLKDIMKKLTVDSIADLVRLAEKAGIVPAP